MDSLTAYRNQIQAAFATHMATEHTYRPALKTLLEALELGVVATNEPKRIKCGAPDFILTRGQTPLGYVEAKDLHIPLDAVETDEQLKRYREYLGNLILTDYLEFRWYVGGEKRLTARLASLVGRKTIVPEPDGAGHRTPPRVSAIRHPHRRQSQRVGRTHGPPRSTHLRHQPLTSNVELFRAVCPLGEELVSLHLMEKTGTGMASYPKGGTNIVESVRYSEPTTETPGRVWLDKDQYFEGVTPEVWQFHVGGYQVCEKWLKDRKGRTLAYDDLVHYERVCAALSETIRLMSAIDAVIKAQGGFPIA